MSRVTEDPASAASTAALDDMVTPDTGESQQRCSFPRLPKPDPGAVIVDQYQGKLRKPLIKKWIKRRKREREGRSGGAEQNCGVHTNTVLRMNWKNVCPK